MKLDRNSPMAGEHANASGNYELICRANDTVINPGEIITIDIMITGYGKIPLSKIVFYPSNKILDIKKSKVLSGLGKQNETKLVWGVEETPLKGDEGLTIGLSNRGLKYESWPNQTNFFDLSHGGTPIISTESIMHNYKPPFQFILKTKDLIKPGNYNFYFGFTYFNGTEWKGSTLTVNFTIRNILQRYERLIAVVGFIAAGVSIIASAYAIADFYKSSEGLQSDKKPPPEAHCHK